MQSTSTRTRATPLPRSTRSQSRAYTRPVFDPREIAPLRPRLLRRQEYERIVHLGLFEGEKVELLYGMVVTMGLMRPAHEDIIDRLTEQLVVGLRSKARVRVKHALALSEFSQPQADLAVVPNGDYSRSHPASALLVVEVADDSLNLDRKLKARLYAEASVPEYWIVNLMDQLVEVYRRPLAGRFTEVRNYRQGEQLQPQAFTELVIAVSDLLR